MIPIAMERASFDPKEVSRLSFHQSIPIRLLRHCLVDHHHPWNPCGTIWNQILGIIMAAIRSRLECLLDLHPILLKATLVPRVLCRKVLIGACCKKLSIKMKISPWVPFPRKRQKKLDLAVSIISFCGIKANAITLETKSSRSFLQTIDDQFHPIGGLIRRNSQPDVVSVGFFPTRFPFITKSFF